VAVASPAFDPKWTAQRTEKHIRPFFGLAAFLAYLLQTPPCRVNAPHAMAINPVMRWQDWSGNSEVDLLNSRSVRACVAVDEQREAAFEGVVFASQ
jgi:hypothetical protein